MSAPVIVLLDDSSDDEEHIPAQIQQLMNVMHISQKTAEGLLRQYDNSVERAIAALLDPVRKSSISSNNKRKRRLFTSLKNESKESSTKPHPNAPPLSDQWHACYKATIELQQSSYKEVFVDPSFPPETSSLDGRKQKNGKEETPLVKCNCGLSATAKVVQRDNENYGKFYLVCGRVGKLSRHQRMKRQIRQKKPSSPSSSVVKPCNFFQWDKHGSSGYGSTRYAASLSWLPFTAPTYSLFGSCFSPSDIRQGAVGNCWFLSALAVVAERLPLQEWILPHHASLNDAGVYQVNLCLEGKWQGVLVDSYLPVVPWEDDRRKKRGSHTTSPSRNKSPTKSPDSPSKQQQLTLSMNSNDDAIDSLILSTASHSYRTAFCAVSNGVWAALVEKAYAKAHGSYARLSGGFIHEAFADLTGAPTETIQLGAAAMFGGETTESLWQTLQTSHREGFIMGLATATGGDGLVGGHAYSVLDVIQVEDTIVGEQCRVTDFFGSTAIKESTKDRRQTVRLLRIRNPWGSREWKGRFSADSEQWTTALRERIGETTYAKGDGTFFMTFTDVLQRFHHLDIAKTRSGWYHASWDGVLIGMVGMTPIRSCPKVYYLVPSEATLAYISIVQPKKRARTDSNYWYCDGSLMILKRAIGTGIEPWTSETCILSGFSRQHTAEVFLHPGEEYCCLVFSCWATKKFGSATPQQRRPFRLTCYSAESVQIQERPNNKQQLRQSAVELLHKNVINRSHKIVYPLPKQCALACVHGDSGCLVFMAINGSRDHVLSLQLTAINKTSTTTTLGSMNDTTFDVLPATQQVLAVVALNGESRFHFRYLSSMHRASKAPPNTRCSGGLDIGQAQILSLAADLLVSDIQDGDMVQEKGAHSIDALPPTALLGATI